MKARRSPLLLLPVLLAVAFFLLPLLGLLWRTPWAQLASELATPAVLAALRLSLVCSLAATGIALAIGLPLAVWLAGADSRLRSAVRVLVTLPMVLPPVVIGVAMLLAYGRRGPLGALWEDVTGWSLPFTTTGAVLAVTYVGMPFFVLTMESGLRSMDHRFGEAAATLGAGPLARFWSVTVPLTLPALVAGMVVCWARALGEFGATITFAGNVPGRTQTLPLAIFLALETDPDAAIVLSLLMVAVSVVILAVMRRRWWPQR